MNRGLGWLLFGTLLAAGCADATFELLPPPPSAPAAGMAGRDDSSKGGLGAVSGTGGTGGTGNAGNAGMPEQPNPCAYDPAPDCRPCRIDAECEGSANPFCNDTWGKCVQCLEDRVCAGSTNPYCSVTTGKCVPCRIGFDCPPHEDCELDCGGQGQRCAASPLPRCGFDCRFGPCTQPGFPHCDGATKVCTECDPDPKSPDNECPDGLVCNFSYGMCVRCASAYNCPDPSMPACNPYTYECQACRDDSGCGSKGPCDLLTGRCGPPQGP